ncbi:MAG TPA: FimD/PapC C-terminal domain-containing protein, partial [Thiopseudomonas sp.]|nr:FimD/PapC C-terminal domain-containing protein [Thiopseudomonas sp.]
SFAILEADNAQGAEILNRPGTYLNRFGQGLVPYVSPYEINSIRLSPKDTSLDVVLQQTQKELVPRGNTASIVRFKTETKRTMLLTVRTADSKPVPMSAEVFDAESNFLGFVTSNGRLFLEAKEDAATLSARWGNNQCSFNYDIAQMDDAQFYRTQNVTCQ